MSTKYFSRAFMLTLAAGVTPLVLCGCGGGADPSLARVSGVITLDGRPLPRAKVLFQPKEEASTYSSAVTNEDGEYELQFSRSESGARIGTHAVWISTAVDEAEDDSGRKDEVSEIVPARYNVETELTRDVAPGENEFVFELSSKSPHPPRKSVRR